MCDSSDICGYFLSTYYLYKRTFSRFNPHILDVIYDIEIHATFPYVSIQAIGTEAFQQRIIIFCIVFDACYWVRMCNSALLSFWYVYRPLQDTSGFLWM